MGKKYDIKHTGTTHHFKATPKPQTDWVGFAALLFWGFAGLVLIGSCAG